MKTVAFVLLVELLSSAGAAALHRTHARKPQGCLGTVCCRAACSHALRLHAVHALHGTLHSVRCLDVPHVYRHPGLSVHPAIRLLH